MKITITIEDNGEKKVTTINQEEFTPLDFYSTEFIESYLAKRKAEEPIIPEYAERGAPFDELVPDEETPPVEIITDYRHIAHAADEEPLVKEKKTRGKRGPYKKQKDFKAPHIGKIETRGRKPAPVPEPKYFSESTINALYNGAIPNLPGVQATKNKFIVQNTYFSGKLDLIRKQYMKYFNDTKAENEKLGEGRWLPILTWESWLTSKYAATEEVKRNINID